MPWNRIYLLSFATSAPPLYRPILGIEIQKNEISETPLVYRSTRKVTNTPQYGNPLHRESGGGGHNDKDDNGGCGRKITHPLGRCLSHPPGIISTHATGMVLSPPPPPWHDFNTHPWEDVYHTPLG